MDWGGGGGGGSYDGSEKTPMRFIAGLGGIYAGGEGGVALRDVGNLEGIKGGAKNSALLA